jgi:hypothetical protein
MLLFLHPSQNTRSTTYGNHLPSDGSVPTVPGFSSCFDFLQKHVQKSPRAKGTLQRSTSPSVDVAYQLTVLLNGLLLRFSYQFPFRGHFESVQTPKSIKRALLRAGFSFVATELRRDNSGIHFAVEACR